MKLLDVLLFFFFFFLTKIFFFFKYDIASWSYVFEWWGMARRSQLSDSHGLLFIPKKIIFVS